MPAPGSYNIRSTIGSAPGTTLKGRTRSGEGKRDAPGPGAYDIKPVIGKDTPQYSLGARSRPATADSTKSTPAPGTYNIPSTIGDQPAISLKSRISTETSEARDLPGPGSYNARQTIIGNDGPKYSLSAKLKP